MARNRAKTLLLLLRGVLKILIANTRYTFRVLLFDEQCAVFPIHESLILVNYNEERTVWRIIAVRRIFKLTSHVDVGNAFPTRHVDELQPRLTATRSRKAQSDNFVRLLSSSPPVNWLIVRLTDWKECQLRIESQLVDIPSKAEVETICALPRRGIHDRRLWHWPVTTTKKKARQELLSQTCANKFAVNRSFFGSLLKPPCCVSDTCLIYFFGWRSHCYQQSIKSLLWVEIESHSWLSCSSRESTAERLFPIVIIGISIGAIKSRKTCMTEP